MSFTKFLKRWRITFYLLQTDINASMFFQTIGEAGV